MNNTNIKAPSKILTNAVLAILLSFLMTIIAYGQKKVIKSKIVDESSKSIPYATIGILEKNYGKVAFEDGSFEIQVTEGYLNDSLVISALGYEKKTIAYREFVKRKPLEIVLKEDVFLLSEVVVRSPKIAYSRIGILKKKSNSNFTLTYPLRGSTVATRFNDRKENLLIKEISVVVGKQNIDAFQLRCRIFSVDPDTGLPGENLLNENLIKGSRKKTETLTFKLSNDFWINEPFYIGFEWITTKEQFKILQETFKAYPTGFIAEIIRKNPGYINNLYESKKLQFRNSDGKLVKEIPLTKAQRKLLKNKNKVSPILKFKIIPNGNKTYSGSSITGNWHLTPHEALISILVGKDSNSSNDSLKNEILTESTDTLKSSNDMGVVSIANQEIIPFNKLDEFIKNKMDSLEIPGASIAIINDRKVVYHAVKGYSSEEKSKVTKQTIFEGASISKSVFGYFVMGFVEEGILDLDKPLYQYMTYPDIASDHRYKKITARMVLCHRSGFPNWRTDTPGDSLFLQFEPGSAYSYSGEGYQYLSKVLSHILKTDDVGLEALFQKRIASPLGMERTRFIQDTYNMEHKAQPYVNGTWYKRRDMGNIFGSAFSIHSEALDFSKWIIKSFILCDSGSRVGDRDIYKF